MKAINFVVFICLSLICKEVLTGIPVCSPDVLIGEPPRLSKFVKETLALPNIDLIESEQEMRREGYGDVYIAGLDVVKRNLRLANALRQVTIHPRTSHIPAFVPMIDRHIHFIREGILLSESSDKEHRLNLLRAFRAEALEVKAQEKVTYRWWLNFNYRLAILATPQEYRGEYQLHEFRNNKEMKDLVEKLEARMSELQVEENTANTMSSLFQELSESTIKEEHWITNDTLETFFSNVPKEDNRDTYLGHLLDRFPDVIVLPTISRLGIISINRMLQSGVYLLGLNNQPIDADSTLMYPQHFWEHDVEHTININEFFLDRKRKTAKDLVHFHNKLIYQKMRDLQRPLRERVELIYFNLHHELPDSIDKVISNLLKENSRDLIIKTINDAIFRNLDDSFPFPYLNREQISEELEIIFNNFSPFAPNNLQSQKEVFDFIQRSIVDFVDVALQ